MAPHAVPLSAYPWPSTSSGTRCGSLHCGVHQDGADQPRLFVGRRQAARPMGLRHRRLLVPMSEISSPHAQGRLDLIYPVVVLPHMLP